MPQIGDIQLSFPFCQAGLAGYSDRAMRLVARRRGCPYAVTEALLDVILLSGGQGLRRSIDIDDEDHPVAGQIIGSEPDAMGRAARILADAGYDAIDLNFACPVKKIKNKARGGHMLLDAERAVAVLRSARDHVPTQVPMTLSLRRGFDDSSESEDRFYQIVDSAWAAGYAAVRVHGRTVEQKYQGRARWAFLRQVKEHYPDKTILGSGDLFTAEDAVRMLQETGVDIAWIARGAIGNPWIFRHAVALLTSTIERDSITARASIAAGQRHRGPIPDRFARAEELEEGPRARFPAAIETSTTVLSFAGSALRTVIADGTESVRNAGPARYAHSHDAMSNAEQFSPPTIGEQREALAEHFGIAMQIHGEQLAGRRMRKMGIKYSRFHPDAAQVKRQFIEVHSLRDWNAVLDRWYSVDGPGIWPDPKSADEVNEAGAQTCESDAG